MRPKAFCYKCRDPIYTNVDPRRRILCWKCTADLVDTLQNMDGKTLQQARIKKEMSQNGLAVALGCSQQFVAAMENNRKCLIKRAVAFILETKNDEKPKATPPVGQEGQKGCMEVADNKENAGAILGGQRP